MFNFVVSPLLHFCLMCLVCFFIQRESIRILAHWLCTVHTLYRDYVARMTALWWNFSPTKGAQNGGNHSVANLNMTWKWVQFEHINSHQNNKNGCENPLWLDMCWPLQRVKIYFLSLNIQLSVNKTSCLGSHTLYITKQVHLDPINNVVCLSGHQFFVLFAHSSSCNQALCRFASLLLGASQR